MMHKRPHPRRIRPVALALCFCALLLPLGGGASFVVETELTPLPWDQSPGYLPDPDCYTADGYQDESLRVSVEKSRRADADFYTAYVEVQHPSQLRTGLADALGSQRAKPTDIAAYHNGVIAISGDFFRKREKGLIIRQGETLRDSLTPQLDMLLIDRDGNFHIVPRSQQELLEVFLSGAMDIQNAFTFGPALVVDGKQQDIPEKYNFAPHYKNPRAAIGQLGPLSYALVVVDGRLEDTDGCTLEVLAQHMVEIGCVQAFNLDGGGSATLVLDGEIATEKKDGTERSISDIIYFATTVHAD